MQMTKTNEPKALHLKCVCYLETSQVETVVNRGLTVFVIFKKNFVDVLTTRIRLSLTLVLNELFFIRHIYASYKI